MIVKFLISYGFLLVDLRKIYFLREIIFVGKSLQTNLGANLFSQKVCKTSFVELICTLLPICKHLKIFTTNSFPIKPLIPFLCSTNILIYILSN